jgi:hypothetical protein
MSIPVGGISETGLLSSQLASNNSQSVASGSFQATLNEMLSPDSKGQVNEEQLFAALIKERLTSMKGTEAAQEFETRYQAQQKELQRPDGYISLEDSARGALESMSDDKILTLEEAETIHGQAFQAAQFDENKNALYDSLGTTMAVTMVEMAIQSAESAITQFDEGTTSADRLAFDMEDMAVQSMPPQPGSVSPADGTYSDGLIWKPTSDTNGDVAIILEPDLKDKIDSVTLRDSNGNILEEKSVVRVDDRGRSILFFNQPGHEYPEDMTVQVSLKDGDAIQYLVANPSNRLGY